MDTEYYPTNQLNCAIKASALLKHETLKDRKIDEIATAYAIINRLHKQNTSSRRASKSDPTNMGDFSSITCDLPHPICFESLAIVAGILAGLYEDPTNGATRFHRHDQCPGWSKNLQPCALLGPYIYYRD